MTVRLKLNTNEKISSFFLLELIFALQDKVTNPEIQCLIKLNGELKRFN